MQGGLIEPQFNPFPPYVKDRCKPVISAFTGPGQNWTVPLTTGQTQLYLPTLQVRATLWFPQHLTSFTSSPTAIWFTLGTGQTGQYQKDNQNTPQLPKDVPHETSVSARKQSLTRPA